MQSFSHKRRGVALLLVIGVLAVMVILAVTSDTVVSGAFSSLRINQHRMLRRVATADLVTRALASGQTGSRSIASAADPKNQATVTLEPAASTASANPAGLKSEPGDALLTVQWPQTPPEKLVYLVNLEGRRASPVRLTATREHP